MDDKRNLSSLLPFLAAAAILTASQSSSATPPSPSSSSRSGRDEYFNEELYLRPLANGDVLAHFSFVVLTPAGDGADQAAVRHFDLAPKVVGEFLLDHGLEELDLALTRGVWRPRTWGSYPPRAAPTGALVSARFDPDKVGPSGEKVDKAWSRLTNALSGQFCASLNFMGPAQTASPEWALQPFGAVRDSSSFSAAKNSSAHFRFAILPGENVCTENLTPWKRLLPCQAKRGLVTLLNARSIQETRYHSLGLRLRSVCPLSENGKLSSGGCKGPRTELSLHLTLVFDQLGRRRKASRRNDDQGPTLEGWSLRDLFGIGLNSHCPLAARSQIFVHLDPEDSALMNLQPPKPPVPWDDEATAGASQLVVYDVLDDLLGKGYHNLAIQVPDQAKYTSLANSRAMLLSRRDSLANLVSVHRHQVGHGQERGGISTTIWNSGQTDLTVVLLEVVPWFLKLFFHTLKVDNDRQRTQPLLLKSRYVPGVDRLKPYTMELVLRVPARSKTRVSIEFEHSILKWHEYPPDANKGFYVSSALISTLVPLTFPDSPAGSSSSSSGYGAHLNVQHPRSASSFNETFSFLRSQRQDQALVQLYTESLLIYLPTPDFSMPYNVICLACTVVALAFGPLVNITTKSLQVAPASQQDGGVSGILGRIWSKFPAFGRSPRPAAAPAAQDANPAAEQPHGGGGADDATENKEDS